MENINEIFLEDSNLSIKTANRRTEVHRIFLKEKVTEVDYQKRNLLKKILENFFNKNLYVKKINEVKFKVADKDKIFWVDSENVNNGLMRIKLGYTHYNRKLDIINVDSMSVTKIKNRNEGDKEKQHMLIKTYDNTNKAILVFEKIVQGVTCNNLEYELNEFIKHEFSNNDFELCIEPIPSKEFLEELSDMKRISLLKVTIDQEESYIDEDISFSEQGISRDNIDLIYKPVKGTSFRKKTVADYYRKYKENEDNSKKKIKRIVLEGTNSRGKVRLDTEGARLSKYISTKLDDNGLIDSEQIFSEYKNFIQQEFPEYLSNIVLQGGNIESE